MSEAKPMDPDLRSLHYREAMKRTHPGRRRYTPRQMRRMRHKEYHLIAITGDRSLRRH